MNKLKQQQHGFVSIIVTMIIIALVSLIALGFAFLARQNQRQSLNRRLGTQAFYAAESGVNDVTAAIRNGSVTGSVTSCGDFVGADLDTAANVKYTCVLVDQAPTSLVYDSISTDSSTVVHVRTSAPVSNLKISWQDTGSGNQFSASGGKFYLPQKKAIDGTASGTPLSTPAGKQTGEFPKHTGMVRATIIPTSAISSTDNLLNTSQTVYMYPEGNASANTSGNVPFRTGGSANTPAGLGSEGVFASGSCNTGNSVSTTPNNPRYCNAEITGVNSTDFYLRLKAIYRPVAVTVTAKGAAGEALNITGAQAVVDSTGKAVDVLRRIQVRVPLTPGYYFPEFAIESANTICKRFVAWTGSPGGALVEPPVSYLYDQAEGSLTNGEPNDNAKDAIACEVPGRNLSPF